MEELKAGIDSCSTTMVDDDSEELEMQYEALDWMTEYSPDQVKRILTGQSPTRSFRYTVMLSLFVGVALSVLSGLLENYFRMSSVVIGLPVSDAVRSSAFAEDLSPSPDAQLHASGEAWWSWIWRIFIQSMVLLFKY